MLHLWVALREDNVTKWTQMRNHLESPNMYLDLRVYRVVHDGERGADDTNTC